MNDIKLLKTLYKKNCKMVDGRLKGGFVDHEEPVNKAIDLAISALEKQIPKKLEFAPEPYDDGIEQIIRYIDLPYCPSCGILLVEIKDKKHCMNCGQAIDWRSEDG